MDPSPDYGFKWFGEGFEGFPKRLPEDTVDYAIYIVDPALDQAQKVTKLKQVLQETTNFTKELLKEYIWQREEFGLELKLDDGVWSLNGRTNYGDSVEDEWLIVYILLEMSKKHTDLWIRVFDTDGEFLLIEAANVLPRWLKPEISENRVWIHAGELRIIPIVASTPLARHAPSMKEALAYISTDQQKLVRSPFIQEEALYRTTKYPAAVSDQLHHSVTLIPRRLAYILHQRPKHISPAIESFYLRDPVSLKPLLAPSKDKLRFPPEDLVRMSVRFTKVGFAQLKSQEFAYPDLWKKPISALSARDVERAAVGMKLTCGFEMLLSDPQHRGKKAVREMEILLEDLESGDEQLPNDKEMESWQQLDDDEGWMNIDYNDFEKELSGKGKAGDVGEGFGDKSAQENLRKMVSRFEEFLNDDDAGLEGAEFEDSDESDEDSSDDEGEDKDASFDEDEFAKMMREMMGLPPDEEAQSSGPAFGPQRASSSKADQDQGGSIREVMKRMEEELKEHGVLNLDPTPRKLKASKPSAKGKEPASSSSKPESDEEESDEEVDFDYTLAKNMLEAFKSQGGASGPAGNLMGLMGVHLPPDKNEK